MARETNSHTHTACLRWSDLECVVYVQCGMFVCYVQVFIILCNRIVRAVCKVTLNYRFTPYFHCGSSDRFCCCSAAHNIFVAHWAPELPPLQAMLSHLFFCVLCAVFRVCVCVSFYWRRRLFLFSLLGHSSTVCSLALVQVYVCQLHINRMFVLHSVNL